nr:EOG090X02I4 [Lepidurus arcticus]
MVRVWTLSPQLGVRRGRRVACEEHNDTDRDDEAGSRIRIEADATAERLNEYVLHYEPLDYEPSPQTRSKRALDADFAHIVEFHAHARPFKLRLRRDTSVFSDNLVIEGHDGRRLDVDSTHYEGELIGEPDALAFGSLRDGIFDGKIHTKEGTFYVERSQKYFPTHNGSQFHSVIYKDEHVIDPYEKRRKSHAPGCGVTDEVAAWMDSIQNSAVSEEEVELNPHPPKRSPGVNKINEVTDFGPHKSPRDDWETAMAKNHPGYYKYSLEANTGTSENRRRSKRQSKESSSTKGTCSLFIQTDPLIWRHIYEQEKRDAVRTREEISSLIAQHVKAVNLIYMNTRFDGKYQHRMIRFEVQRIKMDDYEACEHGWRGDENKFCLPNIDVSNFLNLHSQGNHEDFCLAYVFTYRDFTGGTLGLAWVASASGASGGICERFKTYTENVAGYPRTTRRSLNTGIITFVNYNSRVPPKVSQLTLAHEIGHNFGSPHDYPNQCRPGGQNGNYIMFASATSGERPNNSKFSNCSTGNVSSVLDALQEGRKKNCFTEWNGAFCGNKIVEETEECDCGYDDAECQETCCYPRVVSDEDRRRDPTAQGCKRRPGKQCSPSEGTCCTSSCTFVTATRSLQCKGESECSGFATCNGSSARCPLPPPKANGTECNGKTQVCQSGECSGSICSKWGLRECFLTSQNIDDKRKLCELACLHASPRMNATCKSTSELTSELNLADGISLRPGSPCDNYQGYCDVFLKCRAVDAEGPLARLKNLLFNRETLLTIAQWITEYWWAVLLMGVGFVLFMGVFIKCCAVHTPSSNPKKQPALRITETLRHPYSTLRRKRHQPPGGSAAPAPDTAPGPATAQTPLYPAPNRAPPPNGPAHGYGDGRGHYNRPKRTIYSYY